MSQPRYKVYLEFVTANNSGPMAALSIKDEKNVVALLNPEKSYGFIDLHALHPQLTTTVPVILYRESKTAALNKVSAVRIRRGDGEEEEEESATGS